MTSILAYHRAFGFVL